MDNIFTYNSDIGKISIVDNGGSITELFKYNDSINYESYNKKETPLIRKTYIQLNEYLNGCRKSFTIPIQPKGTEFQRKVWNSLTLIEYAHSKSYKDISIEIQNPKASRAVGNAIGKNPILIIIPCHRVITSTGKLGGFSAGLHIKRKLLKLEDINFKE